jgi:hypothetical protein
LRYVMRGYTSIILEKLNKYFKNTLKIGDITFEKLKDYDTSDRVYERLEKIIEHASRVGHSKTQLMAKSKFRKLFENITPVESKSRSKSQSKPNTPKHTTRRRRHHLTGKPDSDKNISKNEPPASNVVAIEPPVTVSSTNTHTRRRR